MAEIAVDSLVFDFPAGWRVSKYDGWSYYRNQFSRIDQGIAAVDLVAVDVDRVLWMIEAKDYRQNRRTKPTCLASDMRSKVLSTLAGLVAAKFRANDRAESDMAIRSVKAKSLRIVLHIEQPATHSRLFPRAIKLADVQQKLKSMLRSIDAHPLVVESSRMGPLSWVVT